MKQLIGHAIQNIVPCQLPSYFALLYDMVSYNKIINNQPSSNNKQLKNFKQILQFSDGQNEIYYLPPIVAPNSVINFWCEQLNIFDNDEINIYMDQGYSSSCQIKAELNGYYFFYTSPRFINNSLIFFFLH